MAVAVAAVGGKGSHTSAHWVSIAVVRFNLKELDNEEHRIKASDFIIRVGVCWTSKCYTFITFLEALYELAKWGFNAEARINQFQF